MRDHRVDLAFERASLCVDCRAARRALARDGGSSTPGYVEAIALRAVAEAVRARGRCPLGGLDG